MSRKTRLLLHKRSVLFSLLGLLLLAGLWLTPRTAFAAPTHPHHLVQAQDGIVNTNNCTQSDTSFNVAIVTDGGWSVDCFGFSTTSGTYSEPVRLYNVTALYTNYYDLTFTWLDSGGHAHTSSKPWGTFLAPGKVGSNLSGPIAEITYISLTQDSYSSTPACSSTSDTSTWVATNTNSASPYYADCFDGFNTYSVHLYGVYAIETGGYHLVFTWLDYNNQQHTTTLLPWTLLAAGDNSASGFAGADRMALITSIRLY